MHLTQTPVWNAFWVTCCLALIVRHLKQRQRQSTCGPLRQIYGLLTSSLPFCVPSCFLFRRWPKRRLRFSRPGAADKSHSLPFGRTGLRLSGSSAQAGCRGSANPSGRRGSSLGSLFWGQMVFRVQSVTQEEEGKRRKDTLKH